MYLDVHDVFYSHFSEKNVSADIAANFRVKLLQ